MRGDLPHYLINLLGNCLPIIWRWGSTHPFLILVDFFGDMFPCFLKSRPITRCLLLYCTVGLNIVNYFLLYCTVGFKSVNYFLLYCTVTVGLNSVNYFFTVLYSRSQQRKLFFLYEQPSLPQALLGDLRPILWKKSKLSIFGFVCTCISWWKPERWGRKWLIVYQRNWLVVIQFTLCTPKS